MKKPPSVVILIIVFVLLSVGFFYAGMKYGSSKSAAAGTQRFQQLGSKIGTGNMQKGGLTNGDIIAKDDKSITVRLSNGSSKIIFLSSATTVNKFAAGTVDDLQIGTAVSVSGTSNSDGSMTAQSVQLRPSGTVNPGTTPPAEK
jgi:hypothetical protein